MNAFISTISGVVAGGIVTYAGQWGADRRRTKREGIEGVAQLYDRAIEAVAAVEASRRGVHINLDPASFPELTDVERKETENRPFMQGFLRHHRAQWQLRKAMAALPDANDFRRYWDKDHELTETEAETSMALLIERRRQLFD